MSATRKRPRSESPHDGNDAQCSTPVHGSGETVSDPAYHHNRSKALSSLWENRELTDVVVVVEGQRFPAHRVVLAAGSQHFRAMFTRSFAESRADEVELHEIAAEGFQTVALRDGTVESVLLAADRCEVLGLMSLCCDYLLERISRHNCLHFWSLAEQMCRDYLLERISHHNCLHFWPLAEQVNCESLRRQSRLCALKKFEELHQTNRL
ncbi:BTB/POZ protein [Baffinella frigidus]|nr:BTB/POZ protein [Cryptophyta sp. CCMP2293]